MMKFLIVLVLLSFGLGYADHQVWHIRAKARAGEILEVKIVESSGMIHRYEVVIIFENKDVIRMIGPSGDGNRIEYQKKDFRHIRIKHVRKIPISKGHNHD